MIDTPRGLQSLSDEGRNPGAMRGADLLATGRAVREMDGSLEAYGAARARKQLGV